jgi:hypothetical protein
MSEQPVWHGYPVMGTPEAGAAAAGMENEQPMWHGFDSLAPSPPLVTEQKNFNQSVVRGLQYPFEEAARFATHGASALTRSAEPAAEAVENYVRGRNEAFDKATGGHPSEFGLAVGSTIPLIAAGVAAPELAAESLGGRLAVGTGVGAVSGALQPTPTDGNFWKQKGIQAAEGAVGGAAGGVVADRVAAPFIGWLTRKFGPNAAENQAVQVIAKRMTKDVAGGGGPTAQDMIDLFNAAPDKPQALADVAGENVRQYLGSVTRRPGEGRQFVRSELENRDVGAGPRIAGDIDTGISAGGSIYTADKALDAARKAASTPLYNKAFQQQQVWSPRLQEFLTDPVMQQGLKRGLELERLDSVATGRPFNANTLGVDLDPQGNIVLKKTPNMRVLDAGKRGIDAMIGDQRNDITGRMSPLGRSLTGFKNAYLDEIDSLDKSGTYAAARAAYSGPSSSMDAMKAGRTFMNKEPEEIADEIAGLPRNDREFYLLGAAGTLKKSLARTGMGGDEAKRVVGNRYVQDQVRSLFENQKDADRFLNSVTAENRMFETKHKLIGGSHSAERLTEDNAIPEGVVGNAFRTGAAVFEGAPVAAGLSAMKMLGAMTRGESPAVNSAAARMLLRPQTDPQVFRTLQDVLSAQQQLKRPSPITMPAAAAAGANADPLAVPLATTLSALGQYLPSFGGGH